MAGIDFYAAAICATLIKDGGPSWLYLLALLFVWNAFKFSGSAQPRWFC